MAIPAFNCVRILLSYLNRLHVLGRVDFTLQLLMCVTAEKEGQMFMHLLSFQFLLSVFHAVLS